MNRKQDRSDVENISCVFALKSVIDLFPLQYGYRLPETEEDVIYYQVYFRPIGETLFTYPFKSNTVFIMDLLHCTLNDNHVKFSLPSFC